MQTQRLRRASQDRWLLGVCGGIAHTYGWSPLAVRLATVVLAIAIPGPSVLVSLAAYLVLGIFLPRSEDF